MGRLNYLWTVSVKELYSNLKPIVLNVVAEDAISAINKSLDGMHAKANNVGSTFEVVAVERGSEVDLV